MAQSSNSQHQTSTSSFAPRESSMAWDEMTDTAGKTRPHWQDLSQRIQQWSPEERKNFAASASQMVTDLGTTFNVYSDVGNTGQPYDLDPIPLLISPAEWVQISAGLNQRMRLIEAVLADIYGPQQLLKDGLLPPALVHSNPAFLPYINGASPVGGRFVITTGCDLVRSPKGIWSVIRDHANSPNGLGQVLENRNVTSNLLSELFESQRITKLGEFFNLERSTLRSLLSRRNETPNVVFLTPGFRHPSYFEHAYKARLLGFPLVESADLTIRERRLFLKTLAGLRRIDAVTRQIDDDNLDPLEHWGRGGGIPGIVEAWRSGNVALANAPGAGFASSPALMSYLPGICRKWLGEEIKLPFIETWWLNQADIRRRVTSDLRRYVLLSAFNRDATLPVQCASLSQVELTRWIATIEERPYDFVAQLDVTPSETPALVAKGIRHRPVLWRAFTLNANDGPVSLPGGLARIGEKGQSPQLWPRHAGFTKDVWISSTAADFKNQTEIKAVQSPRRSQSLALEVPSRIAEQLCWGGRYAERIEFYTRLLRVTLRNLIGESGSSQKDQLDACLALIRGTQLLSKETDIIPSQTLKTLSALIHDPEARGGIPYLTRALLQNAAAARDRLSDDTWRFFNRLEDLVHPPRFTPNPSDLLRTLDTLVLHLSAFSGMQAENMIRGQGWRFLEIGRRTERALSSLVLLKTVAEQNHEESPLLDPLLETCDSVMTYRRRHFSRPDLTGVIELIFSDLSNPRSVKYQLSIIAREINNFPGDPEFGLMPKIREHLQNIEQYGSDSAALQAPQFKQMHFDLMHFADMITQHYFSHSVRNVY